MSPAHRDRAQELGFTLPSKGRRKKKAPQPRQLRAPSGFVVRSVLRRDIWHPEAQVPDLFRDQWLVTVCARRSGGFEVRAYHPATGTETSMRISEVEATLSFDLSISSLRHWATTTLPFAVELFLRPESDLPRLRCKAGVVASSRRNRRPSAPCAAN